MHTIIPSYTLTLITIDLQTLQTNLHDLAVPHNRTHTHTHSLTTSVIHKLRSRWTHTLILPNISVFVDTHHWRVTEGLASHSSDNTLVDV